MENFRDLANCRVLPQREKALFFGLGHEQELAVHRYCDSCPVAPQCLAEAMREEPHRLDHVFHVRGGLTAGERRRYYRRMRRVA